MAALSDVTVKIKADTSEFEKAVRRVPVPVEIIRPKFKRAEWAAMLLGSWIATAISSVFVMLLIGACHHEINSRIPALGYLQTLLAVYTLKVIFGAVTSWDAYKLWTRERS